MALQRRVGWASAIAVAAVMGMGGAAEAATASVSIGGTATLEARGAAVVTRVAVQCPRGFEGQVGVQVTERVTRQHVTNGWGGQRVYCTGAVQTFRIPVTPFDRPFERGVAFAQAGLDVFNPKTGMGISETAYRTVQIT